MSQNAVRMTVWCAWTPEEIEAMQKFAEGSGKSVEKAIADSYSGLLEGIVVLGVQVNSGPVVETNA